MNRLCNRCACLVLALACLCCAASQIRHWPARAAAAPWPAADATTRARIHEAYGQLPLSFEINRGQADQTVKFLARGGNYQLALTSTAAAVLVLRQGSQPPATVHMQLVGAHPAPQVEGLDELPGRSHYLLGNDRKQWRKGVATYARVRYASVYPGVDLIYYGNGRQLEYDFVLAPGTKPEMIKLVFAGAQRMRIDAAGDLVLHTAGGEVRQRRPAVYQEVDGARRIIAGRYVRRGRRQVGFQLGAYDVSRPVVIDPVLVYFTTFGGNRSEYINGLAVDAVGNAYVVGYTDSPNFPTTPGGLSTTRTQGANVFITKFDPAGALVYSTYLGGHSDLCCGFVTTISAGEVDMALDAAGNVYITGRTRACDFPTTPGALQPLLAGGCAAGSQLASSYDAFVTKLNASGDALVYSTFLGGSSFESSSGLALDAAGNAYIVGSTNSSNFPTTPGAFQTSPTRSAFVAKLNPTGTALVYSTRLGFGGDLPYAVAVDADGHAYLTGLAYSGFPTTPDAFQRTSTPPPSAFVTKLNPTGTALIYSTLIGGSDSDGAFGLAVDGAGNAYVTGFTNSRDFPATPGAFQPTPGGTDPNERSDAFVTKLNATGTALVYSTYLGGRRSDGAYGLAVDGAGNAVVTGSSISPDFPVTADALPPPGNFPGIFLTRLNATGTEVDYSSSLGRDGTGQSVAVDAQGNIYATGRVRPPQGGFGALFIAKVTGIVGPAPTTVANVSAANYAPAVARSSIVAAFGPDLANVMLTAGVRPLPTTLGGVRVKVTDSASVEHLAPLFFVAPPQINYQLPPETRAGAATVTVERGGVAIATQMIVVADVAPGLFAANADGRGAAAAVALRLDAFGRLSFQPVARFDPQQGQFVTVPLDLSMEGDQVFLLLFGTGLRHRSALSGVTAQVGGTATDVIYAGAQPDFVGLDQVNLRLPRSLAGRGEIDVAVVVDGKPANTVKVSIK